MRCRLPFACMGALLLALGSQTAAFAHPVGNFSVNRYTRLEISPESVRARYVLDLAEIPTLSELRAAGVEGRPSQADHDAILRGKSTELASGAQLSLDGRPIPWHIQGATLEFVPGQADLDTTRLVVDLLASERIAEGTRIQYRDANHAGRIGWHEIVLRGIDGFTLRESTVSSTDQTDELRSYPLDPTRPPLDQSEASARVVLGTDQGGEPGPSPQHSGATRFAVDPRTDYLAAVLNGGVAGPAALILALLAAAGLGALHALEPGHGKAIVSGYLVGSGGTARQALLLGLSVTATHTLSVYLLGIATLVAARFILPDRLYPILGIASGLAVVAVGLTLARTRLGPAFAATRPLGGAWPTPTAMYGPRGGGQAPALPELGGAWPRPTALEGVAFATAAHPRPHFHEHGHTYELHEHSHTPDFHEPGHHHGLHAHAHPGQPENAPSPAPLRGPASPARGEASTPSPLAGEGWGEGETAHSHGFGPSHTHAVPGADGSPLTARGLLALGISGGLLPCPSALVVLLAAVSFGNVALGMALVAAFSVGLALVLMGLGLLVVYGGRAVAHSSLAASLSGSPVAAALPVLSALAITLAGVGISIQAAATWA